MGIDDYLVFPPTKERRIRIDNFFKGLNLAHDQSVLDPDVASLSYNFDFSSGALCDGRGVEPLSIDFEEKITHFWVFNKGVRQILMLSRQDGAIFYVENGTVKSLNGIRLEGEIYAQNYRLYGEDVILICSSGSDMVVWNGEDTPYSVLNSPRVVSMAVLGGRLLVIDFDKNVLRYSMDLDPTNWSGSIGQGGYIDFSNSGGKLNKVISFLNYAYVFCDYCIKRISFSASGTPIVTDLFTFGGRIFANTAAIAGDRVIFLCSDGLYVFDGLDTKRVLGNLKDAFIAKENSAALYYNGEYHLAVRLNGDKLDSEVIGCEAGEFVNNGLLVFDVLGGEYCISRGLDISAFAIFDDSLITISGGILGRVIKKSQYMGIGLKKKWRSVFSDFASEGVKMLRQIYINGNVEFVLSVETNERIKRFLLSNTDKVRVNMRGKKFSFSIECDSLDAKICAPTLVISE